jgi:uncharacterized protein
MQITIFGASGMVGKHLVKQALWKGHSVIAFGRNANVDFADDKHENLTAIKGYLTDVDQIAKALKNSQAVLSAIGGQVDANDNTRSLGIKNIVTAMQKVGLQKIAAIGGLGVLPSEQTNKLMYETEGFPPQLVPVSIEHLKAYQSLQNSTLQYSFFCPPQIVDAICDGNYAVQQNKLINTSNQIHAGNLADAMLKALEAENIGLYSICNSQ